MPNSKMETIVTLKINIKKLKAWFDQHRESMLYCSISMFHQEKTRGETLVMEQPAWPNQELRTPPWI